MEKIIKSLKEKPSRSERRLWVDNICSLYVADINKLVELYSSDLAYFKNSFKKIHVSDYKSYNVYFRKAYRLFKKINKRHNIKKLTEDKIIKKFISLSRSCPDNIINLFIDTEIKLRNLLKLKIIISGDFYKKNYR